jgi:hypothetical protein
MNEDNKQFIWSVRFIPFDLRRTNPLLPLLFVFEHPCLFVVVLEGDEMLLWVAVEQINVLRV